jgi:hypothetical protein
MYVVVWNLQLLEYGNNEGSSFNKLFRLTCEEAEIESPGVDATEEADLKIIS